MPLRWRLRPPRRPRLDLPDDGFRSGEGAAVGAARCPARVRLDHSMPWMSGSTRFGRVRPSCRPGDDLRRVPRWRCSPRRRRTSWFEVCFEPESDPVADELVRPNHRVSSRARRPFRCGPSDSDASGTDGGGGAAGMTVLTSGSRLVRDSEETTNSGVASVSSRSSKLARWWILCSRSPPRMRSTW